jgi:hypothetical protein
MFLLSRPVDFWSRCALANDLMDRTVSAHTCAMTFGTFYSFRPE